jgi:uncharacterized protein involved in exopolysaccharide biosynthesis
VLGLLIALLAPKEYSTDATLMPEMQTSQSTAGSLLQQYGGMLGISGGAAATQNQGTIPPQLYPDVVQSLPFQIDLMTKPVTFASYDTTVTPHVFFNEVQSTSVFGYLKMFTIGLPGQIIGLFNNEDDTVQRSFNDLRRDSVLALSDEQMGTVKTMRGRLSASVSQETGVITISSEFPDPQAAAEIGQNAISLLKEYMREYKTQKAMQDLKFVQEQVEKAKKQFEQAQDRRAEFRDSNLNLATAKAETRQQELESQYNLAFNLYNSLKQRLQQAEMQVQEQTPVFSVLQPMSVPLNDNTSGLMILVISGVLGGIIGLGWVLLNSWWKQERASFK